MKPIHPLKVLLGTILFSLFCQSLFATKLADVRPVDANILMVKFQDGEVYFRDDATGITAHDGHRFIAGDDQLIPFGEELDVKAATRVNNWRLGSESDPNYPDTGVLPVVVHRKSKVFHATHDWRYKLDHWLFLQMPHPLVPETQYTLHIDDSTHSLQKAFTFTYSMRESVSEAIHVNLNGYTVDSPIKSADLYLWLGDGGPRDYSGFVGNQVWLLDVRNNQRYPVGKVTLWKDSATEAFDRNLTGSTVWNADFSGFNKPGKYRLQIDGIGCSNEFEIRDDIWFKPYKTSVRGYYYMRVGEPHGELRPLPRQPRFIQGVDPVELQIYMTDYDPYDPGWDDYRGDPFDEPHFKPATESVFWKRRLPGNPTNPNAYGGHSDALDWDRKIPHVADAYDLLLTYIITGGAPAEDNLDIRESGNSIPDLIDEARNQVDFFLRLRVGEAYAHGLTNPSDDRVAMFQAGPTTIAAWANAANCAMLAEALRISGHTGLMNYYRDEAIKAYRFAERQTNQQLDDHEEIGDFVMRGRDFRMMAAAYLYNVTGDTAWEDAMAADSVCKDGIAEIEIPRQRTQVHATAAYLFSNRKQHYTQLAANMLASVRRQAIEDYVRFKDIRPSRRSASTVRWQCAENLHLVVIAHLLETDPQVKDNLLQAMILEADWGLGRNPSNLIEMTGMGPHSVQNAYTSGRNDGSPGLHPGHTPYHSVRPWGYSHNGHNPHWFTDKGYPAWEDGWPHQEAHFNSRYCWSNSEFTPRETMRGKMMLLAYLHAINLNKGDSMTAHATDTKDSIDRMDPSQLPPAGLAVESVPQFIVLTFDDNPDIEPMSWMMDVARDRKNPDGSAIGVTFFSNGHHLDADPELVKLHQKAFREGHIIANHTQNHHHGSEFSADEWKQEMQLCTEAFVRAGIPASAISGFRTPFLEYNAATFAALEGKGFLFDSSLEEGYQDDMDGTNYLWPYTLHNGSPGNAATTSSEGKELVGSHPGLWELAVHVLIVPPDAACRDYGAEPGLRQRIRTNILKESDWDWSTESGKITGYDWNLLEMAMLSGEDFLAILKYSLDQHLKGNRAPFVFGGHTALYPLSKPDRRKALAGFMDYALSHPQVRFVTPLQMIEWMRNPVALDKK